MFDEFKEAAEKGTWMMDLSLYPISIRSMKIFVSMIPSARNITSLILYNSSMCNRDLKMLADVLPETSITALRIGSFFMGTDSRQCIISNTYNRLPLARRQNRFWWSDRDCQCVA